MDSHHRLALRAPKVQLGVERVLAHLGEHHPLECGTQRLDQRDGKVVGEGPGRADAFERVVNGLRFPVTDEDRQDSGLVELLSQHDDRSVGRHFQPDTE